jgi:hypothetical protein
VLAKLSLWMFEHSVTEPAPRIAVRPSAAAAAETARRPPVRTVLSAAVIAALILVAGDIYAHLSSGTSLWPLARASDQLSEADRANRALAFSQLGPLTLRHVSAADTGEAIEAMSRGLTPQGRKALLADLEPAISASTASPLPLESPTTREPPRLVWITLWDTDVEDGDVVRLESGGYSRTVVLTKRGVTFAVPVPADGFLTVTGIKDGDGGGITVGLASGAARAVFPIMSTGQSLRLRVTPD